MQEMSNNSARKTTRSQNDGDSLLAVKKLRTTRSTKDDIVNINLDF